MDALLRLSHSRESCYWEEPSTKRQLHMLDLAGLSTGIITNAYSAMYGMRGTPSMYRGTVFVMGLLQLAQLTWLLRDKRSYHSHRLLVTWMQRLRWLVFGVLVLYWHRTDQIFMTGFQEHSNLQPGTWQAFVTVAGRMPLPPLLSNLNHPLPFAQQTIMTIATLGFYIWTGLPHQLAALDLYQLRHIVQPTCLSINRIIVLPLGTTAMESNMPLCHDPEASANLVLVYMYIVIAVIFPLQLTYWHERGSKLSFLQSKGLQEQCPPNAITLLKFVYLWAFCAIAWGVLGICISLVYLSSRWCR